MAKKYDLDLLNLFMELANEMMSIDKAFKVLVYDRLKVTDLWPLAGPKDIPVDVETVQQYFVNANLNKKKTFYLSFFMSS